MFEQSVGSLFVIFIMFFLGKIKKNGLFVFNSDIYDLNDRSPIA